jgi:magnesium transporter
MYVACVQSGAFRVEEQVRPGQAPALARRAPEQLWLDLEAPTAEDLAPVREAFHLHPLAVEECDHTGVRPKIEEFEDHLYLVFHGINHNPGADELDTVEFKFFLARGLLITIHDRPSSSIAAVRERLRAEPGLLGRRGVDTVLHRILDAIVDHYFPVLEKLEVEVEEAETEVFHSPGGQLQERMLRLQRRLLTLHRLIYPQLDILSALASGRYPEIEAEDLAYFRDVHDHLERINERVALSREMLAGAMQCSLAETSNRMNAAMKGLAVVATLALPASFVTSLMGMNLRHLPGNEARETFWGVGILCAVLSLGLLFWLRRARYL